MPSPLFFGAVHTFSCPTFASKHNLEFEQNHQFASKHELSSISYLFMFRNRRIYFWKLPHSGKISGNSSSFRQNFNSDVKQGSVWKYVVYQMLWITVYIPKPNVEKAKMLIYDKGQIQNFSISADLIFADDKLLLGLVGWLRQSLQYLKNVL